MHRRFDFILFRFAKIRGPFFCSWLAAITVLHLPVAEVKESLGDHGHRVEFRIVKPRIRGHYRIDGLGRVILIREPNRSKLQYETPSGACGNVRRGFIRSSSSQAKIEFYVVLIIIAVLVTLVANILPHLQKAVADAQSKVYTSEAALLRAQHANRPTSLP
jgi:hypothetical protein